MFFQMFQKHQGCIGAYDHPAVPLLSRSCLSPVPQVPRFHHARRQPLDFHASYSAAELPIKPPNEAGQTGGSPPNAPGWRLGPRRIAGSAARSQG